MRIAIVADTFPPLRTSGAVQLRDLALGFLRQGHETTVFVADPSLAERISISDFEGVRLVRLKTMKTKDVGHARRFLGELSMPWSMRKNLLTSPVAGQKFDAAIWYSPTIFLGPFVRALMKRSGCPSYLILRDIFPEWALDMRIISPGPVFKILRAIANDQYRSATVIGVQTQGNLAYFDDKQGRGIAARVEVLDNWLDDEPEQDCSIDIALTSLRGRKVFVYIGNMGVAQDMDKILSLALSLKDVSNVGFLFVGRGSEFSRLSALARQQSIANTLFMDEISPGEIPGLLRQCDVGLVCLDGRHKTHNIPGKFLSYMRAGLPVLASVNAGNDLVRDIQLHQVGLASVDLKGHDLALLAQELASETWSGEAVKKRCRNLYEKRFSVSAAVTQIVTALEQCPAGPH